MLLLCLILAANVCRRTCVPQIRSYLYNLRYYSLPTGDASGFTRATSSFADMNLFIARNNHSEIVPTLVRSQELLSTIEPNLIAMATLAFPSNATRNKNDGDPTYERQLLYVVYCKLKYFSGNNIIAFCSNRHFLIITPRIFSYFLRACM